MDTKTKLTSTIQSVDKALPVSLSQKVFFEMFDNFQDIYFIVNYNQKNEQVDFIMSSAVEKILGYNLQELKNLSFTIFHKNLKDRAAFFRLVKEKKRLNNYPLSLRKKDGTEVFVEIDCEYLRNSTQKNDNEISFSLRGVLKDVTKRQRDNLRSDIAFLIAEKSKRRLTNITMLAEFIHTTLAKVMDVSSFYIALLNEDNTKLHMPVFIDNHIKKDMQAERILDPNGLTEYILKSRKVIVKDKNGLQELIKKEGLTLRGALSECYVGVPLKSEGKCFGVIVMQSYEKYYHFNQEDIELLRFISIQVAYVIERAQWQETLIKKEAHYRSLVENSSEIIGIINQKGLIEYLSESIKRVTGYESSELIGRPLSDFANLDNLDEVLKECVSKELANRTYLLKILDKSGNKKYLEVTLNKNKEKKESLIFNAKDVTQKILAEKKREKAQRGLNILHQIEKAFLSNQTFEKILKDALTIFTKNMLDLDRASIALINYDKEIAEIAVTKAKHKNDELKGGDTIPFKDLPSIKTILKKGAIYIKDTDKIKRKKVYDYKNIKEGIKSYYIKPIIFNNKVIAIFDFGSKTTNYFDSIDVEIMDQITLLIATAINDATLKKELAERESELTTIFNSSSEGIMKTTKDNKFSVVNKGLCDMLGYSEDEMLTKSIDDIAFKDDLTVTKKILNSLNVDKHDRYQVKNKRLIHKNGSLIDVKINALPFYDAEGNFDYSIAFIYDKTEELKAQKQITNIKNALNHTALVFFTNKKGIITDTNERLELVSGYSRNEIIGSSVKMFNSKYHSEKWWNKVWETIKSGETWQGEIRNEKKDGSIFWVFSTITPVLDKKGEIEHFISIQLDITEEKKVKSNLIREVIEAQEHERERFAMEIHDGLGQVLLATKMNLSAMQDTCDGLDGESKIILGNSIDLLTEAIQEARSISHGLMSRVLNRFGLAYAISEIVNNINGTCDLKFVYRHNIENFRFKEEIEMGVYRTLQELIKNILKHSKATKAYLSIHRQGEELSILIEDNGIGIETGTLNNPSSGGIGLRNMRSRIEYLGGVLKIDEKIQKGTSIKINISL